MIDVHCHLADNKFKTDIAEVLEDARKAKVEKIIAVAEFESQFEKIVELARENKGFVYAGLGIHPIQKRNRSVQRKHILNLESYLSRFQEIVVCVGEIGLDHSTQQFKLSPDDLKTQEEVFVSQIRLAKQFDLPVNVHSRNAAARSLEVLRAEGVGEDCAVLHAFDGSVEEAMIGARSGYLFSVPPRFSSRSKEIVANLPDDRIVLETDAPALGPTPGIRNEPAYLRLSAGIVAEAKGVTVEKIVEITNTNANRVFSLE